ncbi:MAG: NAD(P)H-dependent oxidoreductase [Bdellovibrionaceae bacterium]|nr:NAD(P)H-dependent oxidoreductase [Pseudobdellovibrionaceae bacterium]MBX3033839.1 NAD(P)H-dependent oxidoreductase [Pseudobdellovibrionaceae bacterium]
MAAADGHKNTMEFLRENYQKSEIEIIEIKDSDLKPYSYLDTPQDKFVTLIQKSLDADLLVLATPVYWYAMSGPMKDFIDRFSDLLSGDQKELGEALYGKRIQVLSTGSDSNLPFGFEVPFSATAIYFGMDYMGIVYKSVSNI